MSEQAPDQHTTHVGSTRGPVEPTTDAAVRARPVGDVRITGGFWRDRQTVNAVAALPVGVDWLARAGNLDNLRIAAGASDAELRGPDYMDSDVYKLLESAYWQQQNDPEPWIEDFGRQHITLIEAAQLPNGYLHSPTQAAGRPPYARLSGSHEHYCAGHLFQAAVAESRATGQARLLEVARRFADHLVAEFGPGRNPTLDGHPQVETALVELFRETGESPYLELAKDFVDRRGHGMAEQTRRGPEFSQDHLPVRDQDAVAGHAVRALYLEAGVVDVAVEAGDTALLRSSIARWEDLAATRTAITGGHGSRLLGEAFGDRYELPPDLGYNETCAAVAAIHWSWRLLLATGEARYAEFTERLLYNGFAAAMSIDGRRFFKGNPLQRRPEHRPFEGVSRRQEWFPSACCPPNVTRLLASLPHYVATAGDQRMLTVQQYVTGTIDLELDGERLRVDSETDYPWSGEVTLTVRRSSDSPWTLAVRVPSWSTETTVLVNEHATPEPVAGEYLALRRTWCPGDIVRVRFSMPVRATLPHPRIDALRGCVALERGPLVYCVEQIDQPEGVEVDDLVVEPDALSCVPVPEERSGIGRTVVLRLPARVRGSVAREGLPYFDSAATAEDRQATVTAIPYWQWDNRDGGAMRVWLSARD